jgi:hypothetical protein
MMTKVQLYAHRDAERRQAGTETSTRRPFMLIKPFRVPFAISSWWPA